MMKSRCFLFSLFLLSTLSINGSEEFATQHMTTEKIQRILAAIESDGECPTAQAGIQEYTSWFAQTVSDLDTRLESSRLTD